MILLTVLFGDVPRIDAKDRVEVYNRSAGFYCVTAHFGFMEIPDVPALLDQCRVVGLQCPLMETSFFLSREQVFVARGQGLRAWRQQLFALMLRNAANATDFFRIPPNRVIELGSHVYLSQKQA